MHHSRTASAFIVLAALFSSLIVLINATPASAATTSYYVDCTGGNDSAHGRNAGKPWRTLDRANQAKLRPGDSLFLRRGCTFNNQRLKASWNGTAANPIKISMYGRSGNKPVITGKQNSSVLVTGSYLVIKHLDITYNGNTTVRVGGCNQPVATFYGINFTDGAHNNVLTKSVVRDSAAGVHLSRNSRNNVIVDNVIRNNNVMTRFGGNPNADLGAWGLLVLSNNNEISYNRIENNVATCTNSAGTRHSNSIEIFEGENNYIHHNKSFGDRVFSELGGSAGNRAKDNKFEFNLMQSNRRNARFITTRGSQDSFGPVSRTTVRRNTVSLTGNGSVAVSCGQGCNSGILNLRGNILVAVEKALFCDQACTEQGNVFWSPAGQPVRVQRNGLNALYDAGEAFDNRSTVADPVFSNPANGNFRPRPNSPAINRGLGASTAKADLANQAARQGSQTDAGAYEVG